MVNVEKYGIIYIYCLVLVEIVNEEWWGIKLRLSWWGIRILGNYGFCEKKNN